MKKFTMKRVMHVIRKRVKLGTLLLFMLTFSINTFAWFIYATKVDSGVTAHVKAWNVSFEVGSDEITENIHFDISDIYPGMTVYTDSVTVKNNGESKASLSFELNSVTIFEEVYEVVEGTGLTSDSLLYSIANDYPFKINLAFSNSTINSGGTETFSITVSWAYESGDDLSDTFWGNKAYDFHSLYPDSPSISLNLEVSAVQMA